MDSRILLIGAGAREDALSWKLSESEDVSHVYVSPGNAGTGTRGQKVSNVSLNLRNHIEVSDWCTANGISLVVIGPEDPLADGIVDSLTGAGIHCFGPSAAAARIESSKEFAKDLMRRHDIPTARWSAFSDSAKAAEFIQSAKFPALVVKASGLAAGKGVIVAADKQEAIRAAKEILDGNMFGDAGRTVVIEELLVGEEISCLAFSDGHTTVCLPPAQDHKRLLNGDKGPNTGGMGAYCPCNLISESDLNLVKKEVLQKTVDVLREAGTPFVGVLYAGLMLTDDGPKVLEFNCRLGDPETQVLIPLLKSDLFHLMNHCVQGTLSSFKVEFDSSSTALGIVLASKGYPSSYPRGLPITGVDRAQLDQSIKVFYAGASCSGREILTDGGRVLTVVATAPSLRSASDRAQRAAQMIDFEGKQYRTDIGLKSLHRSSSLSSSGSLLTYKESGVDIGAGDDLVDKIKGLAAATARAGCSPSLGQFGGIFDMELLGYPGLVLVSGTDGVGTKLKIAHATNIHRTVGIDLVAMSVNDVLCQGAEPLFFLDYFACGRLDVETAKSVIEGIAVGCQLAGCALIGGETAEMPGMYEGGEYDLAGFVTGCAKKHLMLPKVEDIKDGDVVLGLTSSGLHSNGFSLVRKVMEKSGISYDGNCPFDSGKSFGEYLLTPTKIYVKSLLPVLKMEENQVKGLAHITGGGLPGNVPRMLPGHLRVILDASKWPLLPVFGWIAEKGNVDPEEMLKTFNCGIGMVAVVDRERASEVQRLISESGEEALAIGHVTARLPGEDAVTVNHFAESLARSYGSSSSSSRVKSVSAVDSCLHSDLCGKKRVAVLISGSGTNLQALIDYTRNPVNKSSAEIVLVVSNVASAFGLKRAENAGIPSKFVSHKNYGSREEFDEAVHEILVAESIEFVCLAGFMRILSAPFVSKWRGRMLNTHPSLLPSFKGANAHKMALEAGVLVSGCTVHFVAAEVDAGAIVAQEAVPVYPDDTEDSLSERVKAAEHKVFPKALQLLASGKVSLSEDGRIKWLV